MEAHRDSEDKLRGTLRKGMQQRRLAGWGQEGEGDGDETGPPSPDFTEFCLELGPWSPSNPSPGGPRYSPVFVEDYFKSLDQSVGQPPAQTLPPGTAPTPTQLLLASPKAGDKRPLEEEERGDEAFSGPSWKVPRTHARPVAVQASSSHFVYPGSLGPRASFQPSPGQPTPVDPLTLPPPSNSAVSHLLQPAPVPQPAAPTSASSAVAAFSSAGPAAGLPPSEGPEGGLAFQHPFVRLPGLEPGVRPRPFFPCTMKSSNLASRRHCHILLRIRQLLRERQLGHGGAHNLVYFSEELATNAFHTMKDSLEDLGPVAAATRLGRRFLVLYSLLRASHVLGQNWPSLPWWRELMENIPHQYFFAWERGPRASQFHASLANELSAAIELLKRGVFPQPKVIISLKRRLFCMPQSPVQFKEKLWDPWRQDDEESQKSPETSRSL
ncbi:hypothetical protein Emed_003677 [Eimeria media]